MLKNGSFTKNIDFATNIKVPTVYNLSMILLLPRVDLFNIVLGVLNDNFMRLAVELVNDGDLVSLPVFYPPRFEPQALNVV